MRTTLPSTHAAGAPNAMLVIAAAVYGPTPGSSRQAAGARGRVGSAATVRARDSGPRKRRSKCSSA
jgi:hypothetical protein